MDPKNAPPAPAAKGPDKPAPAAKGPDKPKPPVTVVATDRGYHEGLREVGDKFQVPGELADPDDPKKKSTWFEPVKGKE